jgi:hypothetical protein
MATLTLHIPDSLAEQIRAAAAAEGEDVNNYTVARLNDLFLTGEPEEDPEIIQIISESLDAYDKGERGRPVEEFWAEMDARYGPATQK